MLKEFDIFNHGEFQTIDPLSQGAYDWFVSNAPDSEPWGAGYIVEETEVADLIAKMSSSGFAYEVHDKTYLYSA